MEIFIFLTALFLAYANGANDNFKGVATLFGSKTLGYRPALALATLTTLLGSLLSLAMAKGLVATFSGKGLVPDALVANPAFAASVALGAGAAVMVAAAVGLPISTTHALTGALVGAGVVATGTALRWQALGSSFFLPLLVSPVLAGGATWVLYPLLRSFRLRSGMDEESCLCVGPTTPVQSPSYAQASAIAVGSPNLKVIIDRESACQTAYTGTLSGIRVQGLLDILHVGSAGLVSFARGLNDTPKMVALLLVARGLDLRWGVVAVAAGIAIGGLLNARKVAVTMSQRICPLNHGQGFVANIVTGLLVVGASRLGVPVSTTHVSVGSLFGIGASTGTSNRPVVRQIAVAWVATLPLGALLAGVSFLFFG